MSQAPLKPDANMCRTVPSDTAKALRAPTASIIVRTYPGRVGFLREALASLQRQTYRHWEAIVVEDGGNSAEAVVAAAAADSGLNFRYLSAAKIGRCATGNLGLRQATGDLLGFLDDDDQLLPEHLALLTETLQRCQTAVAAYGQAWEVPTVVTHLEPFTYDEHAAYRVRRPSFSQAALAERNLFPIQAVLFRRQLFDTLGGFDTELENLEDWDLWRRYAAAGDFMPVDRVTSFYRVPGTMRAALARQQTLHAYRPVCERRHDVASPPTPSQRFRRGCTALARSLALQPPIFALRWYWRNWSTRDTNFAAVQHGLNYDAPAASAASASRNTAS
jgi:glycosyltransferase involved in cell wall biosynthesis